MPKIYYQRTQVEKNNFLIVLISAIIYGLLLFFFILPLQNLILVIVPTLMLAAITIMVTLISLQTVIVTDEAVIVRTLLGMSQRGIPIKQIEDCAKTAEMTRFGWGNSPEPNASFFSLTSGQMVRLILNTGEHIFIGSDQLDALHTAIQAAMGHHGTAH